MEGRLKSLLSTIWKLYPSNENFQIYILKQQMQNGNKKNCTAITAFYKLNFSKLSFKIQRTGHSKWKSPTYKHLIIKNWQLFTYLPFLARQIQIDKMKKFWLLEIPLKLLRSKTILNQFFFEYLNYWLLENNYWEYIKFLCTIYHLTAYKNDFNGIWQSFSL